MITFFTTFREQRVAEKNAIRSWLQLQGDCDIIVFSEQEDLSFNDRRIRVCPTFRKDQNGLPYLNELFEKASMMSTNKLMCYCNSDIVLAKSIVAKLHLLQKIKSPFLAVSQRMDLNVPFPVNFSNPTDIERLARLLEEEGRIHPPYGSDIFIFPRGQYTCATMPDLVVGRPGWDNWMIYDARKRFNRLINLQAASEVIHQNHAERYNGNDPKFQVNYHFLPSDNWYTFILCYCNYAVSRTRIIKISVLAELRDFNHRELPARIVWESNFNNLPTSYYRCRLDLEKLYKKFRRYVGKKLKWS